MKVFLELLLPFETNTTPGLAAPRLGGITLPTDPGHLPDVSLSCALLFLGLAGPASVGMGPGHHGCACHNKGLPHRRSSPREGARQPQSAVASSIDPNA